METLQTSKKYKDGLCEVCQDWNPQALLLGAKGIKKRKSWTVLKDMQNTPSCPMCRLLLKTAYLTSGVENLDPERAIVIIESEVRIATKENHFGKF